jgi:DNA-directed RNA polymerase subunit RPC12/RpoP
MSALTFADLTKYQGRPAVRLDSPSSIGGIDPGIEVLSLTHFPRVQDLSPLAALTRLRSLSLSKSASWDGTSRDLHVRSFEPLTALRSLETLQILGVVPEVGRLEPIGRMTHLTRVSIGNTSFYQLDDFAALAVALPHARASLSPIYQMNVVSMCPRCQLLPELYLAGALPRTPKYACPTCGHKRIVAHLERWNRAGGQPAYPNPGLLRPDALFRLFRNPHLDDPRQPRDDQGLTS